MALAHRGPLVGEEAGFEHQDGVAGRQQVGQARLPRAMAGGVVHEQMLVGAQHAFHAGERRIIDLDEIRVVEVDTGAVHRPQHTVGDVGRAGVGEELAAAGFHGHGRSLFIKLRRRTGISPGGRIHGRLAAVVKMGARPP